MAASGMGLGDLGGMFGGSGLNTAAIAPLWEKIQPTLAGLDTDEIVDNIHGWAKGLNLPLVDKIPDDVLTKIKAGIAVPLSKIVKD